MTEADLIRTALERGGAVGPSAAEAMRRSGPVFQSVWGPLQFPKGMSEAKFQAEVIKLAKSLGWHVYHTYDSRRSEPGFPDLVLVRERVIFAETKKESGKQTKDQFAWEGWLLDADAQCYCWRPSDWAEIVRILTPSTRA
jgi:hypothetical protein